MHRLVLRNDMIRYVCLDQEWQTTVLIQSTRVEVFHCYWLQSKGQGSPRESPDEWLKSSLHRSIFDLCFKGSTKCPVALLILFLFRTSEVCLYCPLHPKNPFCLGMASTQTFPVWCDVVGQCWFQQSGHTLHSIHWTHIVQQVMGFWKMECILHCCHQYS